MAQRTRTDVGAADQVSDPLDDERSYHRLALILALTAFAFAQPVLDLLGDSPATFVSNGVSGRSIALFGLVIVLGPPLVIWGIGELLGRFITGSMPIFRHVVVAIGAGVFGVLLAKEVTDSAIGHWAGALLFAVGVAVAVDRFAAARSWLRLLAFVNVLFFAQFAFWSPSADVISTEVQAPVEIVVPEGSEFPSVLMVVFDEWPTQSFVTADGEIDAIRFPNLSAFANEATWYRHHTTVSGLTESALPALLDGRDPSGRATWQDHPENLFSLLANTHNLTESEVISDLCGLEVCGLHSLPSPGAPTEDSATTTTRTETPETDARWGEVFSTAWDIWSERAKPGVGDNIDTFDDFIEEIGEVDTPTDDLSATSATTTTPPIELTEEVVEMIRYLVTNVEAQPERLDYFLETLGPTDEPFFGFIHLLLPHQPWTRYEDGTPYEVAADRTDYERDNAAAWPVRVARQRHILQAEYADRLLGQLIAALQASGEYDDTLIVVVSDHGVEIAPGQRSRFITDQSIPAVAYSPLFIKAPGQSVGVIDDRNINVTDLVPTIADMLGLPVPWETAGTSAADPSSETIASRGSDKYIYSFTDAFSYELLGIEEFDDSVEFPRVLAAAFPAVANDESRVASLYQGMLGSNLIGSRSADSFVAGSGSTRVEEIERILTPDPDRPRLAEIAGVANGVSADATIVVALDGEIVGVSPVYERHGEPGSWVVLLDVEALDGTSHILEVGLLGIDGVVTALEVSP